jgi:hypothetical protein
LKLFFFIHGYTQINTDQVNFLVGRTISILRIEAKAKAKVEVEVEVSR